MDFDMIFRFQSASSLSIGFWFLLAVSVLGITYSIRTIRRPDTNTFCVSSFLVFWITLLMYVSLDTLKKGFATDFAKIVLLLIIGSISVIGCSIGIAGVALCKAKRESREKGTRHAIWGIVLNLGLIAAAFCSTAMILTSETFMIGHPIVSVPEIGLYMDLENSDWDRIERRNTLPDDYNLYRFVSDDVFANLFPIIPGELEITKNDIARHLLVFLEESPDNELTVLEKTEDPESQDVLYRCKTTIDGGIVYLFIRRTPEVIWVLTCEDKTGSVENQKRFDDLITLLQTKSIPITIDLPADVKTQQTNYLYSLGFYLHHWEKEYTRSYDVLMKAFSYSPKHAAILNLAVDSLDCLFRIEEGQALLERYQDDFKEDPEFMANLAWHWVQTDRRQDGMALYATLFPDKYEDSFYLEDYLVELMHNEKYAQALDILERYHETFPSDRETYLLLQARIHGHKGEHDLAQAKLNEAESLFGYTYTTGKMICKYWYYDTEQYQKAIEACNRFVRELEEDSAVSQIMGLSYMELGDLKSAQQWLQNAQQHDPYDPEIKDDLAEVTELINESKQEQE